MFSQTALVALAAASTFLPSPAVAHMIMKTPTPFKINGSPVDNSPLSAGGNQFPCKATSPSSYDGSGISNTMAIGQKQTLSFTGSAVHGGGSCQLALTKDKAPTPSSSWQVIMSIMGGCPGTEGPATFDYTIPQGIAPGDYTFGWTWISKEAGQPEYYMNCAPVTITGGSSKRSDENATEFDLDARQAASFPQLFVANQQAINSCKVGPGGDYVYPDPGTNVQKPNPAASYVPVTQTGCVPKGASDNPSGGSGGNSTSSGSGSGSGSAGSSAAATSTAAGSSPSGSGSGSGSGSSPTTATASSSSVIATPISTPDASPSAVASSAPAAASTAAGSAPPSPSGGGTTSGGLSGPCTTEGMWNCLGGTSFQRCASGQWSPVTPMASGTSCTPGQSQDLAITKREFVAPRFPGLRRHKEVLKNLNV